MKSLLVTVLLMAAPMFAATYYVNQPTGSDSNTTAQAQNPSTPWKTIGKCATNAIAGDTCLVETGTYAGWTPSNSGTPGSVITYQCDAGQTCKYNSRVLLTAKSYITISGFTCDGNVTCIQGTGGDSHITISGNTFQDTSGTYNLFIPIQLNSTSPPTVNNDHIVILNNVIDHKGDTTDGNTNINMQANYSLISGNEIGGGGGIFISFGGQFNVIRGNYFHDASSADNIPNVHIDEVFCSGTASVPGCSFNLIEGNTEKNCYDAGRGNCKAFFFRAQNGQTADTNIARFNYRYNVDAGGGSAGFGGSSGTDVVVNGHAYNNTSANMLVFPVTDTNTSCGNGWGVSNPNAYTLANPTLYPTPSPYTTPGHVFMNELCYNTTTGNASIYPIGQAATGYLLAHNGNLVRTDQSCSWVSGTTYNCTPGVYSGSWASPYSTEATYGTLSNYDIINNVTAHFANFPTDGTLTGNIAGSHLTQVVSGCGTPNIVVGDARFFPDPSWGGGTGAGVQPDVLRVGTTNTYTVSSVNYSTNTIAFTGNVTCTAGDNVDLYSDSNGTRRLYSATPDVGAFPYNPPVSPSVVTFHVLGNGTSTTSGFTSGETPTPSIAITDTAGAATCVHGTTDGTGTGCFANYANNAAINTISITAAAGSNVSLVTISAPLGSGSCTQVSATNWTCTANTGTGNVDVYATLTTVPTATISVTPGSCNVLQNSCNVVITVSTTLLNFPQAGWQVQEATGSVITDTVTGLPAQCNYGTVNALCGDGAHPSGTFTINATITGSLLNLAQETATIFAAASGVPATCTPASCQVPLNQYGGRFAGQINGQFSH